MKKFLLAAASIFALTGAAWADNIVATFTPDVGLPQTFTAADGTLDINNQSVGAFNLNSVTINSQTFLAAPGVLHTNSIDVDQATIGTHTLNIDIQAQNLTGLDALSGFLSSFSVTGLSTNWSVTETTFINGVQQATTGLITSDTFSLMTPSVAFMSNPFTAEVDYTLTSVGTGQFNGGIDIDTRAVPGPIVGAGLPGLVALFGGGWFWRRKRRVVA